MHEVTLEDCQARYEIIPRSGKFFVVDTAYPVGSRSWYRYDLLGYRLLEDANAERDRLASNLYRSVNDYSVLQGS